MDVTCLDVFHFSSPLFLDLAQKQKKKKIAGVVKCQHILALPPTANRQPPVAQQQQELQIVVCYFSSFRNFHITIKQREPRELEVKIEKSLGK